MSNREMRTNFEMALPFNGISTLLPIPPVQSSGSDALGCSPLHKGKNDVEALNLPKILKKKK